VAVRTPELDTGKLDKRVTLLRPVYANAYQDEILVGEDGELVYEPVADVWASVGPNFGQEMGNEGARTVATKMVPVVIRYRSDIDERWRILDREHTYSIDAILDVQRRRSQLQLACKEIR
jgi:SPP1 family predicted phage head-tail adaptor